MNGILIVAEQLRGSLAEITFEMLGIGRLLADELKVPLIAALVGDKVAPLAAKLGVADKVLVIDNAQLAAPIPSAQAAVIQSLLAKTGASLVFVGGTNVSMGIGSILSARTQYPFVNFCKGLRVENGSVVAVSQLFGGKILSDVRLSDGHGIVSIYPGAFAAEIGRSDKTPPVENVEVIVESPLVAFKCFIEPETGDIDITRQEVLVAVGRGIGNQDNLALAEELAAALGGAVCASRPVIDQNWLPLSRQVGKSGMTVKPRAYFAFGISGAPEHWEGMQGSQLIFAVNTDPKAPIFDGAHYGACCDALELLPVLTDKIKARKA